METLSDSKTHRIDLIDALRGFSVLGIALLHSAEHFNLPIYPTDSPAWLATLDALTYRIIFAMFAGKAYSIFALLFGFTFYLQYKNTRNKNKDFGYRFLWRLLLLPVFAALNAAFFPGGDVLLLFTFSGLILFFVRKWKQVWILVFSIFLLAQPLEFFDYTRHALMRLNFIDLGVEYTYLNLVANIEKCGLLEFFVSNLTFGQEASLLWSLESGRATQTMGLFLLGLYMGRAGFFERYKRYLWVYIAIFALLALGPLHLLKEFAMNADEVSIQKTLGVVLKMWENVAISALIVFVFISLYKLPLFRKIAVPLCYCGRASLTNYVFQSIFGAVIFFPQFLFLAPRCGYTLSFLIGLLILVFQMFVSRWWILKFGKGPLEAIWHKWTWMYSEKSKK